VNAASHLRPSAPAHRTCQRHTKHAAPRRAYVPAAGARRAAPTSRARAPHAVAAPPAVDHSGRSL